MKRALKHVAVFGKRYAMQWDSPHLDDGTAGDCSQALLQIRISPRLAPDEERETVLHELTHAVEHQLGINLNESKVRQLSVGLFAVLRDNPTLRRYLFSRGRV